LAELSTHTAYKPIGDYAIIGDCRSAALVSREGSLDWLCWPRFDSPSIFAALLDSEAGHWRIAPTAPFETKRRYVDETNVLETRFQTETGSLLLIDLMPLASEEEKRTLLLPEHEILRLVVCEEGEVEVEILFDPGLDTVRERSGHGMPDHSGSVSKRVMVSSVSGRALL
jgi:GH15 family glucan-1,4-alpha-glucosidase